MLTPKIDPLTAFTPKSKTVPVQPLLVGHYQEIAQQLLAGKITPEHFAQELAQTHQHLERRADHDGLIQNFLNNNGFGKFLDQWLEIMRRVSIGGSLLALDIDHLKRFNDTQGHVAGDQLIRIYARVIEQQVRAADLKGRLGGDEFAAFLIGSNTENAVIVAERIRLNITAAVREFFPKLSWEQTISIGVTEAVSTDTAGSLRDRADKALYEAKRERNKTVVFPREQTTHCMSPDG